MEGLGSVVAVVLAVVGVRAGMRFVRRQRSELLHVLAMLHGQRVTLGLSGGGRVALVLDVDAMIGRVRGNRVLVSDVRERLEGQALFRFLALSWFRPDKGIPLDRIRWIKAGKEQWNF